MATTKTEDMMKRILILMLAGLAAMTLTACEVSTAKLTDVKICDNASSDGACSQDMTTFAPNTQEIFLSAQLENAPSDTRVTATWRYLRGEAGEAQVIDEVSVTTEEGGTMPYYSSMPVSSGEWPEGDYEIVLDLGTDNSEPIQKQFTVK